MLKPEERGKQWIQALTFCRSQQIVAPTKETQGQNQFHLQQHWRPGNPEDQCSCRQAFWYGPNRGQQSLSQLVQTQHTIIKIKVNLKL